MWNNRLVPKGKETWIDGSSYEGNYIYGKRQGYGIFKWPDGSEYEGDFKENMFATQFIVLQSTS